MYPVDKLRTALLMESEPLARIEQSDTEWWLGSLSLDKSHPRFRKGWSFELQPESRFVKQPFDLDGKRGHAVIFHAIDDRGAPTMTRDYFVGWVPPERESTLDRWLAFLNNEVARLLGKPHREGMTPDDDAAEQHEHEREVEHFERTRGIKPLKLD